MMPKFDIEKVAFLTRIAIDEEEKKELEPQLEKILEFVETLQELDTSHIDPKFNVIEMIAKLRKDIPHLSLPREKALENAPETDGKYFIVPKIVKK
jgi:aspartyl-tRNA(Asn)/glutamyl-tRNA(Gln) amidotransferase subunit C